MSLCVMCYGQTGFIRPLQKGGLKAPRKCRILHFRMSRPSAPSRIRTCDLPLRRYLGLSAIQICGDAGLTRAKRAKAVTR
jgi:hypothetical protein